MIRKLPPELVREIAAGEVVTGVADVVRELLENALDAGATRIQVELEEGGLSRIALLDNGAGIPKDELSLAVEAHASSKLFDLARIATLGFRGEGLYAIRQAGRLKITSRPSGQLGGATLEAFGEQLSLCEHPAPAGTRVEVRGLFEHLPARRQSLEAPAQEARKVTHLLSRYLLHHPGLWLKLIVDGEERLAYAGGGFAEAARLVWGSVTANRLLRLEFTQPPYQLSGLLSRPELSRPRRDRLFLAINGRPVEWPEALARALLEAYRELLPAGQYPVGVVNLELPPEEVLVNTAPDKSRPRLLRPEPVLEVMARAVQGLLASHPLARALPEPRPLLGPAPASGAFPKLRYLGVFRELYLLAEADDRLYVVDQHAAHERVIYEELSQRYREEAPVELAHPELLTLSPDEEVSYLERSSELERAGLILEPFGPGRYRVRAVPAFLAGYPGLVAEVVRGALGGGGFGEAWRAVLARLACLPAIKAGHSLSQASAQALLDSLAACELPWVCPHGRPTALVLSELELARRFGRRSARALARLGDPAHRGD
ncbi:MULTISPECIES: DNA mismatch repair endonuclease MutL [unclassified Meiothermus]|uniref:DNA mismatch repair endonuclease MutL n=1 Tax=unclassified Meiothermus TaxID=370471 RepID=UPI000D7CE931|nr:MULTISPECIES: DNA mismatch repair endonuclease MutL [unclassified Meiothermus]PZA08844.1 DNA mismatch repair protein MutL [Meiothermus sp. Pnk-1]RYM36326.1 DNA mismatch repair endonuclease MutL [Meiothermus sp. PNK-Is4]